MTLIKTGNKVRVKSAADIQSTLNDEGCFEGMPFMPEMMRHCGRVFTVSRSAHKTCDTVNKTRGRQLGNTVHLEDLRCDGAAHGGCEAVCLIFWKSAWLEPVDVPSTVPRDDQIPLQNLHTSEEAEGFIRYRCQATLLPEFTQPLPWWHLHQYWNDIRSGNEKFLSVVGTMVLQTLRNMMADVPGHKIWRALHNLLEREGVTLGSTGGSIPDGQPTPTVSLDLAEGEWVEVKPYEEIFQTLNQSAKNRGMRYDIEMRPHSGKRARVLKRVTKIIDETTGRMLEMRTPCIILEGIYCESRFSEGRLFCPRRLPSFWREAWLKRIDRVSGDRDTDKFIPVG